MKTDIITKEAIEINAPASKVWDALTKPELVKQYFFGTTVKSTWQKGSPINWTGEWEGKSYHDKGTILDVQPGKMVKYSYWSSMGGTEDKPENYVDVTYKLQEKDGKTKLTVLQENIPDEKMREHSSENWRKVIGELKKLVERQQVQNQ